MSPDASWLERCANFGDEVIAPRFAAYDRDNCFPKAIHDAAYDRGVINADFPVDLGGAGLDDVSACLGAERLASVCAPCTFTLGFNRGALHTVLVAGTSEQKQVFVRDLLARRGYAALCLTEPDLSGSNLMNLKTVARRTDRGWALSGTKAMVGNGGVASLYVVAARAEVDGQSRGLTFFAVPRTDAVEVSPNTDKLGFRAVETPTVTFRDALVSDDHRLGPVGGGAALLLEALAAIRVGGGAVILGLVVGALRDALPWVESREVYGGPLVNKSHVQLQLGDLYGRLLAARQVVLRSAELRRDGQPYGLEAAVGKLQASALALDATATVSQLFGWRGIDNAWPIQKRFRDARQTPIFEGTTELQQLNLFRTMHARFRDTGTV